MHVLIWSQPWPTQGNDLFFGLNAFTKNLLVEAQALITQKCKVTIAFPDAFLEHVTQLRDVCDLIPLNTLEIINNIGGWSDPSVELYTKEISSPYCQKLTNILAKKLPTDVDCILLWETPAPYLKELFPEALIVNQMPGAFTRAPYPQTVTFDTLGLYRQGTMYRFANEIISSENITPAVSIFRNKTREIFRHFPVELTRKLRSRDKKLVLLPLQVSDHYAFKADTGFISQAEFCIKALSEIDKDVQVVVTQYISTMYKDTVMTPDFLRFLRKTYPNVVFDEILNKIPSVSQHILQDADHLAVATSGLGLQAMVWNLPLQVIGNTHLTPYDRSKVNTDARRDRVLSFALLKNQPLASKLSKGKFLVNLIEELQHRKTKQFEERFPSFSEIDSNYEETLLSSFRSKPVERDYAKAGLVTAEPSKASQFSTHVSEKTPELISFDLFDTLVIRGFEAPADLYKFIELEISRKGLSPIFDFASKRLSAELAARTNAKIEEISLSDIYAELSKITGIHIDELHPYMQLEIDVEVAACHVRPTGQEMFQEAKNCKIPIVVTSDMYLPRACIDAILLRAGYAPDDVYLSSDLGITKKSGNLFDYICKVREVHPAKIIHVGDNIKTDVQPAKSRGITAFHVPKSSEYISKHPSLTSAFGRRTPMTGLGRSVIAGAIAHKIFDDPKNVDVQSISKGDAWILGYVTVGPLLIGMATWLRQRAIEMDIKSLHFLSREGKILKDTFDRISLSAPVEINSNYLYGSRRAIRVAQLSCLQDIHELAAQTIDATATIESLLTGRFGLKPQEISETKLRSHGYKGRHDKVGRSNIERAKLYALLDAIKDDIITNSESEAVVYKEYLKKNGLFDATTFAVVDVGWNANMQGSLGQIIGKPITGFYLASLEASTRWKKLGHTVRAYIGEEFTSIDRNPILANRLMIENILCDITPSVERVQKLPDGSFGPVYTGSTSYEREQLIGSIQQGALAFVDDVCRTLGPAIADVDFHPDITTPLISDFLASPLPRDAELFVGAEIEDAFSGASSRYYLAPKDNPNASSTWKAGEDALRAKKQTKPKSIIATLDTNAYRVPVIRKPLVPIVRVFVSKIGNASDLVKYDANPSEFFARLKSPWYRRIGRLLFPAT